MDQNKNILDEWKKEYHSIQAPDSLKKQLSEFMTQEKRKKKKPWFYQIVKYAAVFILGAGVLSNLSVDAAEFLEKVPILGAFTKVITIRNYFDQTSNTTAEIQVPHVNGLQDQELEKDLNNKFAAYGQQLIEKYQQDVKELVGSDGYEGISSSYQVITEDERKLVIQVETVITRASGEQYYQYYTVDKQAGKLLKLSDLFEQGGDYITPISNSIVAQMRKQMAEDSSIHYFLPEEELADGFQKISENQEFFLNDQGHVVITFQQYEVAPGYMGGVTFEIPTEVIAGLLADTLVQP